MAVALVLEVSVFERVGALVGDWVELCVPEILDV